MMVPASGSASAIVSGMRSAPGPRRTMTNWPGRRICAIRGASTTSRVTLGDELRLLDDRVHAAHCSRGFAASCRTDGRPHMRHRAHLQGPKVTLRRNSQNRWGSAGFDRARRIRSGEHMGLPGPGRRGATVERSAVGERACAGGRAGRRWGRRADPCCGRAAGVSRRVRRARPASASASRAPS